MRSWQSRLSNRPLAQHHLSPQCDVAEIRSRLDVFVKDIGIVTSIAREAHVATPIASAAQQLYLLAENAGLGPHDDSSVVLALRCADGA